LGSDKRRGRRLDIARKTPQRRASLPPFPGRGGRAHFRDGVQEFGSSVARIGAGKPQWPRYAFAERGVETGRSVSKMVFSSITFLFYFLPIFLASYFLTPTIKGKNVVTLLFSLVFYAWGEPRFVIILLVSIVFNFFAALIIDERDGAARRIALAVAVAGNLLVLALFKYANFVTGNLAALLAPFGLAMARTNIALPLGISFFTFHCLSYIIDIYRRRFRANRDPIDIALYISLFPQLVAGPIVRYKTVARQLDARRFTLGRASVGARIFIVGLAQKVLVADVVAPLAQVAFDQVPNRSLFEAWIGLISYTVQIYFDFAGYSNMAIGLGVVLGFTFPRNFRMPYTSLSITEFWRRWHISLSSWLRDYLYIPLGGNRGGDAQTYRNLVMVFLLCGLWHGANWTFVLWGAWHGAFLVIERVGLQQVLARFAAWARWAYAFMAVMGGWVLFRAANLSDAIGYYASLFGRHGLAELSFDMHDALSERAIATLIIGCVLAVAPRWLPRLPAPSVLRASADVTVTFALLILSMITVAAGAYSPFLYFRF
jgi:alginate O-acetyltransferase complex protein AlgI